MSNEEQVNAAAEARDEEPISEEPILRIEPPHEPSVSPTQSDPPDLDGKSFGWILLNHRESIFDMIADGKNLDQMLRYFGLFTALFAALFGATLGFYALNLQIVFAAVKAPILIFGTVAICLPALFTFNMLLGSKLSFKQTSAMLSVTAYIMATVLVSLSLIVLFFIVSTSSKNFILLLNVAAFGIAGLFGVRMLWMGMNYLTIKSGYEPNRQIIQIWTLIYIFVGTQLAWILRPFIGSPGETVLFRNIEGNFYQAVFHAFVNLIAG